MNTAFPFWFRSKPKPEPPPSLTELFLRSMKGRIKRVLFVDDDPEICETVKLLERRLQMEVVTCGSNADAARILGEQEFDVVILDFRLMNGISAPLYQKILSEHPRSRVVFITGGSLDEAAQSVHAIGPAPVYSKPDFSNLSFLHHLFYNLDIRARPDATLGG